MLSSGMFEMPSGVLLLCLLFDLARFGFLSVETSSLVMGGVVSSPQPSGACGSSSRKLTLSSGNAFSLCLEVS